MKLRVLIIEDNEEFNKTLVGNISLINGFQFEFETHDSIESFLSSNKGLLASYYQFDLVFIDFNLNGANGTDLIDQFKEDDKIPITILMSGLPMISGFIPNERVFVIQKPFDIDEVFEEFLSLYKTLKEN